MIHHTVPQHVSDLPLGSYLPRALPTLPPHVLRRAIKARDIKRDGVRLGKEDIICGGDTLVIYIDETKLPKPVLIPILYEDDHIMVVDKPSGLSVEEDEKGGASVLGRIQAQCGIPVLACHRLDHHTSGLLLLGKNPAAQESLMQAFAQRQVEKRYHCWVLGKPKATQTLKHYAIKDAQKAIMHVYDTPRAGAVTMHLSYRTLQTAEDPQRSLLEVTLHTGRTHQIRAQLSHIGHPLLGDDKYGDYAFNQRMHVRRQALRATCLTIKTAPPPLAYLQGMTWQLTIDKGDLL